MDNKKNVVKSLLAAAEECGLQGTSEYRKVKQIISRYDEKGRYAEREDMRGRGNKGSWSRNLGRKIQSMIYGGAALGLGTWGLMALGFLAESTPIGWAITIGVVAAAVIDECSHRGEWGWYRPTDSENLDENMYKLYEKIQEMRAVPKQE